MLTAFFADIHANRQAFDACLVQARGLGAARIVLLGDYVGYGADPEWTVTTVMDLVEVGARQDSFRRKLLGSVSAKIAEEAPCSVTVVRPPRAGAEDMPSSGGDKAPGESAA